MALLDWAMTQNNLGTVLATLGNGRAEQGGRSDWDQLEEPIYLLSHLSVAVALGGPPVGAPIVGWVANRFGPRWALGIGASSGFAAALVAVYVLTRRTERLPEKE
jgi:MFS family permease